MKISSPLFLVALGMTALSSLTVNAALLVQYQFGTPGSETIAESGPAYSPTTLSLNLLATPVSDPLGTVGIEISSAATTPANAPFLRIDPQGSSTSAAIAITNNKYFQFTITPATGYVLNSTSLTFNAARGGGGTPRGYVVRSSADGFAADLAAADLATARPTYTPVSIDLTGPAFQNLPDSTGITFRIYSYAPAAGNSVDYDDITLNGTVDPVPEPTSLGFLGVSAMSLLGFARRRRA